MKLKHVVQAAKDTLCAMVVMTFIGVILAFICVVVKWITGVESYITLLVMGLSGVFLAQYAEAKEVKHKDDDQWG